MSNLFDPSPVRRVAFHGRISTIRGEKGFDNYLKLTTGHYQIRVLLNGKEYQASTADPDAGFIEILHGAQKVTMWGLVEIRIERKLRAD